MKKQSFCVIDVESKSRAPIDRGPAIYFADPDAALICLSYKINDKPTKTVWLDKRALPAALPAELLKFKGKFVAHNWFFEWSAFKRFAPKTNLAKIENWLCTQAMSRRFGLAAPRSSLEQVAALLKIPVQKNPDGKRLINTYSIPDKKTGQFAAITGPDKVAWMNYCADDVEAEVAIFARLWPRYSDDEKAVFEADKRQQARGVPIDLKGVDAMLAAEEKFSENAQKEAERIAGRNAAGTLVLSGTGEFLKWLEKTHGVNVPNAQAGTLAELAANTNNADLLRALEIRQALMSRAAGKAAKLKERTSLDGRYYNPSTYGAAHTGRWQSWGANFFNFYKYPVESEAWEKTAREQMKRPTKKGLASLQRGLIAAPPGRALVTSDWRGIENYESLFFSGDIDQLRRVEAGESQYLIFGEKLFGRPIAKKDAADYTLAKAAVLSLGYGAGHVKFRSMAKMQGIELTEEQAQRIVKVWRDANPYVTSAWKKVEQCFRAALDGYATEWGAFKFSRMGTNTVVVTLPNGYELYYRGAGVDGRELYWRPDGVTPEKIYGGLLWENLMQAVAAQLLRRALVSLENQGIEVVLHVYDEIVVECDEADAENTAKLIADTMRCPPLWALKMKLEVEQKITKRWGK